MKKVLIIEGGGMRSSYAAGALVALHELKHNDFDLVLGSSAGACCAVNFLGGKPERNYKILHDFLTNSQFIDYTRLIYPQKNIVNMDYLFDEVIEKHMPLPIEEMKKSKTELYIVATNCNTGKAVFLDAKKENVREALRASCALPYLYRREIIKDGTRLMDGGIAAAIPLTPQIRKDYDEIFVISTRPKGYRKKQNPVGWINFLFFSKYPEMVKTLNNRWREYNQTMDWLENPPPHKKVVFFQPQRKFPISRTSRNPKLVKEAYQMGYEDAYKTLTTEA